MSSYEAFYNVCKYLRPTLHIVQQKPLSITDKLAGLFAGQFISFEFVCHGDAVSSVAASYVHGYLSELLSVLHVLSI